MIFLMMILSTVTGELKTTKRTTKTTIKSFEKGLWLNGRLAHTYFLRDSWNGSQNIGKHAQAVQDKEKHQR